MQADLSPAGRTCSLIGNALHRRICNLQHYSRLLELALAIFYLLFINIKSDIFAYFNVFFAINEIHFLRIQVCS